MSFFKKRKQKTAMEVAIEAEAAALSKRFDQRLRATLQHGAAREETRAYSRKKDLRVALAIFAPESEKSCRIVDHSYSGMQIELLPEECCPEEFALTIPTLAFIGVVRKVWQNGNRVGVSILRWSEVS
ncbi:MAG: hypothetical protein R3C60_10030 [Parvularculaceae bacterium]